MALVEIQNLNFYYPGAKKPALRDIVLSVEEGQFVLIAGPSGCGKSTLLRRLKPVLASYGQVSGGVFFGGEPVEALTERRQAAEIGFVMQDPEMQIVTDKVWHELAFGLENLGTDQRTMRVHVAEMANFFGIQSWYNKNVSELSGGQKQLLCLAAVMVMQPRLLLLDEPTSQLDPIAAGEFFDTLKRINTELGTTIIVTEHRTEALFPLVDKVVFMRDGGIFYDGSPRGCAELFKTAPDFTAVLPTAMTVFAGVEANGDNAPLTVREGRSWLESKLRGADVSVSSAATEAQKAVVSKEKETEPVIRCRELFFRYERDSADILKGASFDIRSGELFCIMGGNGAGKTTAIMAAAGMYRPYRGKVLLDGKSIFSIPEGKRFGQTVGVLLQNPRLAFVKDSIREELQTVIKRNKLDPARMDEVVKTMDLSDILDSNPYDISGGELQRAAIAKLLLAKPRVLFLDEATKGMDAFFKARFGELLRSLCAGGMAVVLVSHDIEFCAEYADRLAMFFDGGVIAEGTPREVLSGNSFYTTAAGRIARDIIPGAVTAAEIVSALKNKQ